MLSTCMYWREGPPRPSVLGPPSSCPYLLKYCVLTNALPPVLTLMYFLIWKMFWWRAKWSEGDPKKNFDQRPININDGPGNVLLLQVSLRRQQVSERLNEWAIFNEKNKELCEWLTQMESKVSQNGDISIEEMIDKLRKVTTLKVLICLEALTCFYLI